MAHHLADAGIGPGDHIGIYGLNSAEWLEAALAAYKIRAVPVNVNYRYVADELRYLFDNADLKAVVHDRGLAPRVLAVRDSLPLRSEEHTYELQSLMRISSAVLCLTQKK